MATKYADRAFLSINGAILADVQRASLRRNFNARAVKTMSKDGKNKGYVQGNTDYDLDFELAVQNQLARPKLESIDYENNDVALTFICGAEQFVCRGLFPKEDNDDAPGVGEEVKNQNRFGCLDVVDAVGNSSLFNLSLN